MGRGVCFINHGGADVIDLLGVRFSSGHLEAGSFAQLRKLIEVGVPGRFLLELHGCP